MIAIFNEPLNIDIGTFNEVKEGIADLIIENFTPIDINLTEFKHAVKIINNSKVSSDDGLSSYMILNINNGFLNSIVFFFYPFIFKYGVVPTNFNNIHIVPIVKDKNKSSSDLSNLRPISISNTLAQIFERLIKIKIPLLSKIK
jgi:hypothetical protein